jgi:hypothetical protein
MRYALVRHCALPKVNHLFRTVPPARMAEFAGIHDNQIQRTLQALLKVKALSALEATQATLRLSDGGLGLPRAADISEPAFIASTHNFFVKDRLSLSNFGGRHEEGP